MNLHSDPTDRHNSRQYRRRGCCLVGSDVSDQTVGVLAAKLSEPTAVLRRPDVGSGCPISATMLANRRTRLPFGRGMQWSRSSSLTFNERSPTLARLPIPRGYRQQAQEEPAAQSRLDEDLVGRTFPRTPETDSPARRCGHQRVPPPMSQHRGHTIGPSDGQRGRLLSKTETCGRRAGRTGRRLSAPTGRT
jgi:hypothetical protein